MIYDQKIDQAEVIWNNKAIPLYCNYDRVKSISLLKVTGPTEYFFRIKGATQEQIFESPHYKISIIKDEAPKARITLENGRLFNINQDIPITYTCEDDIALDNIFLTYELRYAKIKKTIALHKSLESPSFNGTYHFSPAKLNIKAEDILTLTIKAEDQRNSEDGSSLSNSIQVNIMPSAKDVSLTDKNDIAEKEYGQERDINEIKRPTPKKKKIETHEGEGQRESQLKEPKLSDLNQKDDKIQKDNNILTEYQRKIIDEFKKELKRLNKSRWQ